MTNVKTIEVFQGRDEQWYWRAKAGNNEIVASSESYGTKTHVLRAVQSTWPATIPVVTIDKKEP